MFDHGSTVEGEAQGWPSVQEQGRFGVPTSGGRSVRVLLGALLVSATFALAPAPLAAQRDSTVTVASQFDFEFVSDPQVSPDGRQIIFTRRWANTRTDQWDTALWIMDADGSRQRFLTNGGSPRWSPDGTRILYVATGEPAGARCSCAGWTPRARRAK